MLHIVCVFHCMGLCSLALPLGFKLFLVWWGILAQVIKQLSSPMYFSSLCSSSFGFLVAASFFFLREYFSCDSRVSGFLSYMEYGLWCDRTIKSGETFSGQCFWVEVNLSGALLTWDLQLPAGIMPVTSVGIHLRLIHHKWGYCGD